MVGGMHDRGGMCGSEDMHGRVVHGRGGMHAWQGVCMVGGIHARGGVCGREGMHGRGVRGWGVCIVGGACMAGVTATAADGMHPTGMHSC